MEQLVKTVKKIKDHPDVRRANSHMPPEELETLLSSDSFLPEHLFFSPTFLSKEGYPTVRGVVMGALALHSSSASPCCRGVSPQPWPLSPQVRLCGSGVAVLAHRVTLQLHLMKKPENLDAGAPVLEWGLGCSALRRECAHWRGS